MIIPHPEAGRGQQANSSREGLELASKPHVEPMKWGPRRGFETDSGPSRDADLSRNAHQVGNGGQIAT